MKQLFNNDWFFHREPLETTIDTLRESAATKKLLLSLHLV